MSPGSFRYKEKRINTKEWGWVLLYSIGLLAVTSIPYLIGFFRESQAWRFSGFVFNVEDGNSYIAKMLQGSNGAWLFRSPYSAEDQAGVLAFLPYILLGKLAPGIDTHTRLVVIYHIFRWFAGIFSLFATYGFMAFFIEPIGLRRLGLVLASIGGGLGWILVILGHQQWMGSLPLEFYSPETFGFLSIYGIPHLAMARGLILIVLRLYLSDHPSRHHGFFLGALGILAGLFQPLAMFIIGTVMMVHLIGLYLWFTRVSHFGRSDFSGLWKHQVKVALTAGLVMLPFFGYNLITMLRDPYVRQWTQQNLINSPHPLHYLLAYGLLIPISISGARMLLKEDPWKGLLPVLWVAILPLLAYFPFNLQRRLPDGIWIALLLLVLFWMDRLNMHSYRKNILIAILLIVLMPSSLILLVGGVRAASVPRPPVFVTGDQLAAFNFLAHNAVKDSVILTSFNTGNALPAWAPMRVVIGHGPESVGLEELRPEVERFYSPNGNDFDRINLINRYRIDYVYWGLEEGNWYPASMDYLRIVFDHRGEKIYQVINQ